MRIVSTGLVVTAGLMLGMPGAARAQIPPNLLQQLLPGSQGQAQQPTQNVEQAVREAYERGYRQGRQDQERSENNRAAPQRGYQQQPNPQGNYQQPGQNYQPNQYGR